MNDGPKNELNLKLFTYQECRVNKKGLRLCHLSIVRVFTGRELFPLSKGSKLFGYKFCALRGEDLQMKVFASGQKWSNIFLFRVVKYVNWHPTDFESDIRMIGLKNLQPQRAV